MRRIPRNPLAREYKDLFADQVRDLFNRSPTLADVFAELPFGDGSCFALVDSDRLQERIADVLGAQGRNTLKQQIADRLCARELFHQQKPDWAPELPLDPAQIEAMTKDPDYGARLVGYFADSMRQANYNYEWHPSFRRYCCGMLSWAAPYEMRTDPELLSEFPYRSLKSPKGFPITFAGRTYILGD